MCRRRRCEASANCFEYRAWDTAGVDLCARAAHVASDSLSCQPRRICEYETRSTVAAVSPSLTRSLPTRSPRSVTVDAGKISRRSDDCVPRHTFLKLFCAGVRRRVMCLAVS